MTTVGSDGVNRRSRDHILPIEWGGKDEAPGGGRNLVVICQECNARRATCMHCWAIVACVEMVARDTGRAFGEVYRAWKLGHFRQSLVSPGAPHSSVAARKHRNAKIVEMARLVDRIGLDEFVYPADTPARQVWNMATLARR